MLNAPHVVVVIRECKAELDKLYTQCQGEERARIDAHVNRMRAVIRADRDEYFKSALAIVTFDMLAHEVRDV